MMRKLQKNENGFSAVEIVLVLVIIVLIGAVGWLVYKDNHKNTTTSAKSTSASTKSSTSTSTKTTTTPAATNPYAGWKTYCDTQSST